jgi:hypothetical protein
MPCPGWPDVTCSDGRTARDYLNEIVARAETSTAAHAPEVRAAAARWRARTDATMSCEEMCAKVYAAHAALSEPSPAWTLALQALADDGAVPARAAPLAAGPTVVSVPAPASATTPSRAASPRATRPPAKRAAKTPSKKKKKKAGGRASQPAKRQATTRSKATRQRGRKPKARKPASRGSRARPRKRRKW